MGPGQASIPVESPTERPYRSHKFPACDFCRKRKSGCVRITLDEPCSLCRFHRKECLTTAPGRMGHTSRRTKNKLSRAGAAGGQSVGSAPVGAPAVSPPGARADCPREETASRDVTFGVDGVEGPQPASLSHGVSESHSRHIIGPNLARDAHVLDQYMSPRDGTAVSHVRPNPYSVYSDDPRDPVVYMKVPRQRSATINGNGTTGFKQCEIINNILGPLGPEVVQLYFDVIHPAFPILDKSAVIKAYRNGALPHALTCEIYAVSILFWKLSPTIAASKRPPPDVHYIWNLAVSAMHKDFLSPTFSTVLACVLDIWGRPITTLTYNAVNIGSTVSLAQSLGLNRNPSDWNLDPRQKILRIKAWWGLLIHDYWASLCHGIPSRIHLDQWDVPLPELDALINEPGEQTENSEAVIKGAHCFIALCQLTTLLGEVLPLIYTLRRDSLEKTMKMLQQTETSIDEWEASLPQWLNAGSSSFDRSAPGALNLRLSYLALGLCIRRVALQEARRAECSPEEVRYQQSQCRKAAASLIEFVTSLSKSETQAFWMPYTAYHFVSAATLMMRCALEAQSDSIARNCVESARSLIDYLRKMKTEVDWDLASICLGQCETTVRQMGESSLLDFRRKNSEHSHGNVMAGEDRSRKSVGTPTLSGSHRNEPHESGMDTPGEALNFSAPSTTEAGTWQMDNPGDFYFPELWQSSYFDISPGTC